MLVGARVLGEGGGVNAGLGGEGRGADIGRVPVRRAVEQFVEGARDVGDLPQRLRRDAGLETLGEFGLQSQRRDEGHEIGVAAALAEAVQRALHLPRAGADGGERIGDRVAGVVVGVDAETFAGNDARDLADDALDLMRAAFRRWCRIAPPSARRRRSRPERRQAHISDWPCSRRRNARNRPSPRGPRRPPP